MRSYGQYCGLAKALDVVGDRWTLLIVRELLIGESRYTDLLTGLPGIATNLLASRLDEMEQAGLVTREVLPPPAATAVFRLTPRGEELRPVIRALGQWAGPLMTGRTKAERARTRWLVLPAQFYLQDRLPAHKPVAIQIHGGDALRSRRYSGVFDAHDPSSFVDYLREDPNIEVEDGQNGLILRRHSMP